MGLYHGDLKDLFLKDISIDQYEPKTGESSDTIVLGFQTSEHAAGDDLFDYLNKGSKYIKDVDVTPNKNKENYYMVFIEIDRNEESVDRIIEIIKDVENLTGRLKWQATTHIHDDPFPVDKNLGNYVATSPEEYISREDWEEQNAQESLNSDVLEFFKKSSLQSVDLVENSIKMKYYDTTAELELVSFGPAKDIMAEVGIAESALQPLDLTIKKFNKMLGEMRAVRIDEYIVIFDNSQNNVLVAKEHVVHS